MTCQYCHQPARRSSHARNCCCMDQHRNYRRLYYYAHRERVIEQQVRYQLKKALRLRTVDGKYARAKPRPWTPAMVQRWNRALEGSDGWKRLRDLLNMNHEKARKRHDGTSNDTTGQEGSVLPKLRAHTPVRGACQPARELHAVGR